MLILSRWLEKKKLGEKSGHTNLHENATESSLTAQWIFCCKVLLLVNTPLGWQAEPGGVVGETIVWLFFPLKSVPMPELTGESKNQHRLALKLAGCSKKIRTFIVA